MFDLETIFICMHTTLVFTLMFVLMFSFDTGFEPYPVLLRDADSSSVPRSSPVIV